jgi:trans-aconitate methyltransferase
MAPRSSFDRAYYDRYYRDPKTRVDSARETAQRGRFVSTYLAYVQQPVRTVLDVGCGVGAWRSVIGKHFPHARYTGVEISGYLCAKYGWRRGSIVDFRARTPYDLVICQGVLQYLPARDAQRAIDNLAQLCSGALFLEVLTGEDWEHNCDRSVTDGDVYLRPAAWYRRRLSRGFSNCGGGMFLSRRSPAVLYELEKAE